MRPHLLLIVVLLTGGLCAVGRGEDPGTARPNVLFLICDDLNCDLACYGHPQVKSPHIDRLARRGVQFDNAYCQFPLCGPSRASFMTGLYPDQSLVRENAIHIRQRVPDVQTMPQMFRDHGYFATRIGKIYHYNVPAHIGTSGHDDAYSWDYTINPRGRDKDDEDLIFSLRPGRFGGTLSWLAADGTDQQQTDGIAATEAIQLLREHAKDDRRFFLAVGLFRPHTPFVAPRDYFELYPREKIVVPELPPGYLDTLPDAARQSVTRKEEQVNLPDDVAREAIQAYYASITFADAQVGRVLAALEETGLADNTIVVFTSDHGYHMGEHGHWQKTTLFENAARVPLIIANGIGRKSAAHRTKAPAEMVDLYPTLAELCGLSPPECLSGVSLLPVLKDPVARPRRSALTQYADGYSVRTARYRYTHWGIDGADGDELYDHESDPQELVNLANRPGHTGTVQRLAHLLGQRIAEAVREPVGVEQIHSGNE